MENLADCKLVAYLFGRRIGWSNCRVARLFDVNEITIRRWREELDQIPHDELINNIFKVDKDAMKDAIHYGDAVNLELMLHGPKAILDES